MPGPQTGSVSGKKKEIARQRLGPTWRDVPTNPIAAEPVLSRKTVTGKPVPVCVAETLADCEGDPDCVAVWLAVRLCVRVTESVWDCVGVDVRVRVWVAVSAWLRVADDDGVCVRVGEPVCVPVTAWLGDGLQTTLKALARMPR